MARKIKRKENEEASRTKNENKATDGVQMEHRDSGGAVKGQKKEHLQEEDGWKREEGGVRSITTPMLYKGSSQTPNRIRNQNTRDCSNDIPHWRSRS